MIEIDAKKHGFEGASGDRIKESNLEEWEVGSPSVRCGGSNRSADISTAEGGRGGGVGLALGVHHTTAW